MFSSLQYLNYLYYIQKVCRKLLQLDSRRIDARDIGGRTALHLAAFKVISMRACPLHPFLILLNNDAIVFNIFFLFESIIYTIPHTGEYKLRTFRIGFRRLLGFAVI